MSYSIGSLFDGSGGFPLAGTLCGIEPRWASEVEPYPIAVTRTRFPNMKHLGDISKINGAEIEPVDVVTFGSPCQDLSVAGRQAGLKHQSNGDSETTRSGLFMEAVRIIKEMRRATNGNYPKFAVWENVPGAFSSNKGEDFRTVLEEIIKISEPEAPAVPSPEKGGWPYADCIMGNGWSLAYRTFDAQHWGVPQRRRRIYLVADFRGQRAGKVLFEREGIREYFAETQKKGQKDRTRTHGSTGAAFKTYVIDFIGGQGEYAKASCVNPTLRAGGQGAVAYEENAGVYNRQRYDEYIQAKAACTLTAVGKGEENIVVDKNLVIRKLTPTECARLQGFADWWAHVDQKDDLTDEEYRFWLEVRNTHATINGRVVKEYTKEQMLAWYNKLHSDSAEYKMWGNGIALPPSLYCMQGIADALEESAA